MQIGKSPLDAIYAESIKPIRNQMRRYNYQSLLDAMLIYLNSPSIGDVTKTLKRLPWVVERLVIWLFAEKEHEYGSKIATEKDVRRLAALAWNAADKGYDKGQEISAIELFVRQIFLAQTPYQQGLDPYAFGLQLHLLQRLPINSKLRGFLDEKAGMPIADYFEIALLYLSHSINEKPWFNENFVRNSVNAFTVDRQMQFLNSITGQVEDFQLQCRARTIRLDEWFQPTYFYRMPCVWHMGAAVPLGPQTFRRYFETLIAEWVAESGRGDLRQDFDKLIEAYVAQSLCRAKVIFLREQEIKRLPVDGRLVDFLVDEPDGVVLLEVKNKVLSHTVPASRDPLALASRLKATIVKAQNQLVNAEKTLRLMSQYRNRKFYRLIVTSNDLWLSNAELLLRDKDENSKTWLVSLRELDMLSEIVKTKSYSLSDILAKFEESQKNSLSATFGLAAFLERLNITPEKHPAHLLAEVDAALGRVTSRLSQS